MSVRFVSLKLKMRAQKDEAVLRLSQIPGVVKIKKTFLGDRDPDLATLYTASVVSEKIVGAIKRLSLDESVEFAEKISA